MALDSLGSGRVYPFEVEVCGYSIDGTFAADWGRLTEVNLDGDGTTIGVDVLGYRSDSLVPARLRGFADLVITAILHAYTDEIDGTRPHVDADRAPAYI